MIKRIKISRGDAVNILITCKSRLTDQAKMLLGNERIQELDEESDHRDLVEYAACGVRNGFLGELIRWCTGVYVEVIGEEEQLFTCPCCGFATLTEKHGVDDGGWEICRLCNWEDSGKEDPLHDPQVSEEMKAYLMANMGKFSPDKWNRLTA